MTVQDRNLYTKYHFHQGEYGEYTTEYKGYCIEIAFDEVYNRYEADAFDLIAEELRETSYLHSKLIVNREELLQYEVDYTYISK